MSPYCNNLQKGDVVLDVKSGRRGVVSMQPREKSLSAQVTLDGTNSVRTMRVKDLRLVLNGTPEDVAPHNGEWPVVDAPPAPAPAAAPDTAHIPPPPKPVTEMPDAEKTEASILQKLLNSEAGASPLKMPASPLKTGEHIKSYVITYIDKGGAFHCEKIAAKGIVTAIAIFYMHHAQTAIVSVVCVL